MLPMTNISSGCGMVLGVVLALFSMMYAGWIGCSKKTCSARQRALFYTNNVCVIFEDVMSSEVKE
jgi:hypothetical protein